MMRRTALVERQLALCVIALVALAMVAGPLVRGEIFAFRDHGGYFQPMRWFTAIELGSGRLPLWNPYNASGEPWLANPQTGVFYPPTWIFLIAPFPRAYVLYLLLHILLLGGGAFALFARRVGPPAALVGAVGLMVCGPVLSLLDVTNNFTTFAWLPLVLWCALSGASPRLSAFCISMSFLAGEPFFAAVGAVMFAGLRGYEVARLRNTPRPRDPATPQPRNLAITAIAALGLTSIQLLPFLSILRGSDRTAPLARELLLRDSMMPADWVRIVFPPELDATNLDANLHQHFIPIVYCGIVVVALALLALVTSWRRRDTLAWVTLFIAGAVAAAGWYLAPVEWIYVHLPLKVFRYPARLVPICALALAALAAIGWEWIAARATWRWLPLAAVLAISLDGLVHGAPLLLAGPFGPNPSPYPLSIGRGSKFMRLPGMSWTDRGAWMEGYINLFDRRFDAGTAAPLVDARYLAMYDAAFQGGRLDLLDQMSIGYLIGTRQLPAPFQHVASARGVGVYRNPLALPMAYLIGDDGRFASATFLSLGTSFARIDVDARAPGLLVLTQQSAPGWEVTVDRVRTEPGPPAAGVFRTVRVPKGHHAVEWRYRPPALRIGAICTLLALLWWLFGAFPMRLRSAFVKRR
jgi:hypothetical protein